MNMYSQYIEVFYYNSDKHSQYPQTINDKHLTYICHPLSIFKLLIVDVLLPILYPYVFPIFTYESSYAWGKNLVGHIIKLHTTFFIILEGSFIKFYTLKMTYSSSRLLWTSINTQPSHITTPYNVPPFPQPPFSIIHHSHNIVS